METKKSPTETKNFPTLDTLMLSSEHLPYSAPGLSCGSKTEKKLASLFASPPSSRLFLHLALCLARLMMKRRRKKKKEPFALLLALCLSLAVLTLGLLLNDR